MKTKCTSKRASGVETTTSLFTRLIVAQTPEDVRRALHAIGDHSHVELDKPFGPLNLQWHPFGSNSSNLSTIGLATKPGRALTERVTNAIDAVMEARVPDAITPPSSPQDAAQKWFGRPVTAADSGLYQWKPSEALRHAVNVVLLDSGAAAAPTVDVLDSGIGISPDRFPATILSLQAGNKISKRYLMGSFGQGGAASLAFSDYVLIVSRSRDDSECVGFTLIRVLAMGEGYKEDTYAYLSTINQAGDISVPSFNVAQAADLFTEREHELQLYGDYAGMTMPNLGCGTLVRQYGYRLTGLDGPLLAAPGNLYHYLNASLFDALLPFQIIDVRDAKRYRQDTIIGARNRLMRLVTRSREKDTGTEIRHHRAMEYVSPIGSSDACIGIEYWVALNYRKKSRGRDKKEKDEIVLRPQSNELYITTGHPVVGTLNGQNQGELTSTFLRDLGLPLVARHLIIHLDASRGNNKLRRDLFSTSREGFKDGPVLDDIRRILASMLSEDPTLQEIENELTDRLASSTTNETSDEVKREVTALLREAGFQPDRATKGPSEVRGADEPGEGGEKADSTSESADHDAADRLETEPLLTLPYPEVTYFNITSPKEVLRVRERENRIIQIETDAADEFQSSIAIRVEPNIFDVISRVPLSNGRARFRLRGAGSVGGATTGRLTAVLTRPDGTQISAGIECELLPAAEGRIKRVRGAIPPFEIIGVDPVKHEGTWNTVWPELAEAKIENKHRVAYRPLRVNDGIHIFFNTSFDYFADAVERLKTKPSVLAAFKRNYEIWIGYHGILQETMRSYPAGLEPETIAEVMTDDASRVGQMQVKQALHFAELQSKLMKSRKGVAA